MFHHGRTRIVGRWLALAVLLCSPLARADDQLGEEAPDVLYRNGLSHFSAGQYAEAAKFFRALFDRFGKEPEYQKQMEGVLYALGCALYNSGDYAGSVEVFHDYLTRYPQAKIVDEAYFRIGGAQQAQQNFDEAIKAYREMLNRWPASPFAEDASYQIAICRIAEEQNVEAIKELEAFTTAYPDSDLFAQAKVFLARAYFQAGKLPEALQALESVQNITRNIDHLAYANSLAIEIGDTAFDNTDYDQALRAYRQVRTKASLILLEQRAVDALQNRLAFLNQQRVDPTELPQRFREERRMKNSLQSLQDSLTKLQAMPDYDAGLFHRIGRCFYAVDRYWEARVAFARVVTDAQDPVIKEAGHFDLVLTLGRLRRFDDVIAEADRYLAAFSTDDRFVKNGRIAAMAFMRAEAFINTERFEEAEKEMAALLEKYPDHPQRARIEFFLALSKAMLEKFADAEKLFRAWLHDHANSPDVMEAEYWLPVTLFYAGKHDEALPLMTAYAAKYPMSVYAAEAEYRAALCKYALERYQEAGTDLAAWLRRHPDHYFRWEARVTEGDAFAAAGMLEEAKAAYRSVTAEGGSFYYLALTQLANVYKALGQEKDYREMSEVFAGYVRDNPDSPNVVEAAYQAGWALRQIKRMDEARQLYANIIERYGNNRTWEGFGPLLKDWRGLYGDQPPGTYESDFAKFEEKARNGGRVTLLARLVLAKRLAEKADPLFIADDLTKRFAIEAMDAEALAFVGNTYLRAARTKEALPYLDRLLKDFPASPSAAVAYARKADVALDEGRNDDALDLANTAVDKAQDPILYMEATFARGRAHQALGHFEDAVVDFDAVVANRIAPRALKPKALLGMAECYETKGDLKKAIPFYQRIYVMYQAYTDTVVTAYLRSAQVFEKLSDPDAAANTYREMLGLKSLEGRPELEEARSRLAKLGSS